MKTETNEIFNRRHFIGRIRVNVKANDAVLSKIVIEGKGSVTGVISILA